jgi:hypothetical protein
MARSDVNHYGLLNRWPVTMFENPYHFNQLAGANAPLSEPCDEVYIQQNRDDIADGLNLAVEMIAHELGFYPRPVWITERLTLGHGWPMEWQSLRTQWGYVTEFSIETQTLIEAGVAITYSDEDEDGIDDWATISVATTVDEDEIQVYFRAADGASAAGSADWEIEPLTVSSDGATATITGPIYLFTNPDVVWINPKQSPNYRTKRPFDSADDANYVTHVDVYRVYGETTGAVKLITDPIWDSSTANSGDVTENAVGRITDSRLGLFQVRLSSCVDPSSCSYAPTEVWVSYKAGYALRGGLMDRILERALIRAANTQIPYQPDQDCSARTLSMWRDDNEYVKDQFSRVASPPPWGGMKKGEWQAWNRLKRLQLPRAYKITSRG